MNIGDLKIGQRVQIHPAADAWMQGDRYGTIVRVGRSSVHVKMDRSGRVRWFPLESIYDLIDA